MLPELWFYEELSPGWLMDLPDQLTVALLRENLTGLMQNALVYPGSGFDWSPIRQMVGITHSFIFFECHKPHKDMLGYLRNAAPVARQGTLYCDVLDFETKALRLVDGKLRASEMPKCHPGYELRTHGWGLWAIYDTCAHGRISVLILQQEAIGAIASLFAATNNAPRILVLQDHGSGGNCWPSFGQPYECLINQLGLAWPEFLIVDNDYHKFREKRPYETLCNDIAIEAQHGNNRSICLLNNARQANLRDGTGS